MHRSLIASSLAAASLIGLAGLAGWTHAETAAVSRATDTRVYTVDTVHSSLVFKIRHAGLANFYGRFNDFTGEIHFDQDEPANSRMSFTVQTGSVDTGNSNRDAHLRNADFFNSRQYPTITFTSTGIKQAGENEYEVTGDLTLQGETRPITARLTDVTTGKVRENDALGFEATFSIKRSDFGMNTFMAPDKGEDGALGNTVGLTVSVEAVAK